MTRLMAIRKRLGHTQAMMAEGLGLSRGAYRDLEAGVSKERDAYVLAAEYMSLVSAVTRGDIDLVAPQTRALALYLADLASRR